MGARDDLGMNNLRGTLGDESWVERRELGTMSVAAFLGALLKEELRSGAKEMSLICFMLTWVK